ncbi:hypothetical protein ZIOFF_009132 [Zingiber officinale]|uniref:Uncharacterized protein n=1 Tax=Zingiber officinale TaxID=94328 RepID=A0A8J5LNL6_ZINOF|nr:hypothetical protein ZIOFF_009132 [Zingiber officinale]
MPDEVILLLLTQNHVRLGVVAVLPKKKWEEKVENLRGLGWSQDHVSEVFAKQPHIARVSTEKARKIVKSVEEKLAWTPNHTMKNRAVLSMSHEKRLRMPLSTNQDTDRFNEAFDEIKKIGICPKKTTFVRALGVVVVLPKKKWEEKVENLRGLGWSQDHVSNVFAKQPHIARVSTEKARKIVKSVEEKLAWTLKHTMKN